MVLLRVRLAVMLLALLLCPVTLTVMPDRFETSALPLRARTHTVLVQAAEQWRLR